MKKIYQSMIILECIGAIISFLEIGFSNLVYYTILSNLLALFVSIFSLQYPNSKRIQMVRFGTTVCLTLTFMIVFFIFVPFSIPSGTHWNLIFHGPQFFHHVLCPLLAIYAFCKKDTQYTITAKQIKYAVIPTLVYGIILTICNITNVVYGPYPFLHVHEQSILASILWFIGILSATYGVAYILAKVHNQNK